VGHAWGEIVHKQEVTWLAGYKETSINHAHKYIFLAANSKMKGLNDMKKYETSRRLKDCIDEVRRKYQLMLRDSDLRNRQLATAAFLIDRLALRVGNEKSEEEADTVGCCSLRVEHIAINEEDQTISLDFLGKDSMRYYNVVKVDALVLRNLSDFLKNKQPADDLFEQIDASKLNDFLRGLMEGLTAKVFRTFNASYTLQNQLAQSQFSSKDAVKEKLEYYEEANKTVAILCNHQKTIGKNFDLTLGRLS